MFVANTCIILIPIVSHSNDIIYYVGYVRSFQYLITVRYDFGKRIKPRMD